MLKRLGYPWSLYVYPTIVGDGSHALTWKQIEELSSEGVEVECVDMSREKLTESENCV